MTDIESLGMLPASRYLRIKQIQKSFKKFSLTVTLKTDRQEYAPGEPIQLTLSLSNDSHCKLHIYKLGTIFDGGYGLAYEREEGDPLLDNFVHYPEESHEYDEEEEEKDENYFSIDVTDIDICFTQNIQSKFFDQLGEYKLHCIRPYCYHSQAMKLAGKGIKVNIKCEPIFIKIVPQEERDLIQKVENERLEQERLKQVAIIKEAEARRKRDEEAQARFEEEERLRHEKKKAQEAEWKRQREEKIRLEEEKKRMELEMKQRLIDEEIRRIADEKRRIEDESRRVKEEEARLVREEQERVIAEEKNKREEQEARIQAEKDRIELEKRQAEEKVRLEEIAKKVLQDEEAKLKQQPEPTQDLAEKKPKTRTSRRKPEKTDITNVEHVENVEPIKIQVEPTVSQVLVEKTPIIHVVSDPMVEKVAPVIHVEPEEVYTPERVVTPEPEGGKKTLDKEEQRKLRKEKRRGKRVDGDDQAELAEKMPEKLPVSLETPKQDFQKLSPLKEKSRIMFGDDIEISNPLDIVTVEHAHVSELVDIALKKPIKRFQDEIDIDLHDEALEIEIKTEEIIKETTPESTPTEKIGIPIEAPVVETKQDKIDVTADLVGISDEERKLAAKRDSVIKEFVQTERTYVGDLHNMENFYINFMVGFLTESDMKTIFDGFDDIVRVNDAFLVHLDDILYIKIDENATRERKIAQLMIDFSKEFVKYEKFVLNFGNATTHLRELKKSHEKFKTFLAGQRTEVMTKTNNRHNDINSILITPVQRLPRYRLLLQDLLRNISPAEPEGLFQEVQMALDKTHAVTVAINEKKKRIENRERLMEIVNNNELGIIKGLGEKEYIRDLKGASLKSKLSNSKVTDCDLYLFSDSLFIKYGGFLGKKSMIVMPLHNSDIMTISGKTNDKHGLILHCKDKTEKIFFKNEPSKEEWFKDISNAIEKCKKTKK